MPAHRRSTWADITRRGFLCSGGGALALRATGGMRLQHSEGEQITVFHGERPLFAYRYDTARPKPYVHPLYLPNGEAVTVDGPRDHVHHRGLMVAWSELDGIDFWGETNPAPHGKIVHQKFESLRCDARTEIVAVNHWIADTKLHLIERRTLRAGPPLPEGFWLDWISELTAPAGAALNPGEHVYDGLGIRFVPSMDGAEVLNERGTTAIAAANGQPANWCTYHGPLVRPGETGGVAFFDHPSNPRHPTPFFVMNKPFGYMSAAPTFRGGFDMHRGQTLTFHWGILSYMGKPEPGTLNRLFRDWSSRWD